MIVVAAEPVLTQGPPGQPWMQLYGRPGLTNIIEYSPALGASADWKLIESNTLPAGVRMVTVPLGPESNGVPAIFYRARASD